MNTILKNSLIGDELLIGIFNEFPKDEQLHFKADIISVLYEANKKTEFKELFENYSFDDDNLTDISSPEIEDGLHMLMTAQLFYIIPPNRFYVLTKGIEVRHKKFIQEKLNEYQIALLKSLAEEVRKNILN